MTFEGEITGLIGAGLFVRFEDVFEGFVPSRTIRDDYYELTPLGTGLQGRRGGRRVPPRRPAHGTRGGGPAHGGQGRAPAGQPLAFGRATEEGTRFVLVAFNETRQMIAGPYGLSYVVVGAVAGP